MIVNKAKAQQAAEALGVTLDDITTASLGQAYRDKSRHHHPDVAANYDASKWDDICQAKMILLKWLDGLPVHTDTCRVCGGTGRISAARPKSFGAKVTTMMCPTCHGKGK
jgi:DnaJ-class molecular chaperone